MKENQRLKVYEFLTHNFRHFMQSKQKHILAVENTVSTSSLYQIDVQSDGLR